MEHRKNEAMKILEQSEELFKTGNFRGALSLASQARGIFPSLPGLDGRLIAYRVHVIASEKKLPSGDTNWHSVLGAEPSSDPEVIRKNYYFLHFHTNPYTCKSAAAESALNLLNQAWNRVNSSSPRTTSSSHCPAPQTMKSPPRLFPPPARSGAVNPKPAEFGGMIEEDSPILCKFQSNPENNFSDPSSPGQPEDGSRRPQTSPPPQPGIAEARSFTQHFSSLSGIPNFLLCPFCGTRSSYMVIDGLCYVTCKQCGIPSSIRNNTSSSNKNGQTGGAKV